MGISLLKTFAIFGIVSAWAEKALSDGKVTLLEATRLVTDLADVIGIPAEIEVPRPEAEPDLSEEDAAVSTEDEEPTLATLPVTPGS